MLKTKIIAGIVCAAALSPIAAGQEQKPWGGTVGQNVPAFKVRTGYTVTLAAEGMEETRFLEVDPATSTLFISQPKPGKIVAMKDANGDGVYESPTTFVEKKRRGPGRRRKGGRLWVTAT